VDQRRWHSGRQLNPRVEVGRLKGNCRVELEKLMRKYGRIASLLGFGGHGRIALPMLCSRWERRNCGSAPQMCEIRLSDFCLRKLWSVYTPAHTKPFRPRPVRSCGLNPIYVNRKSTLSDP
jgi:hypothetical protein